MIISSWKPNLLWRTSVSFVDKGNSLPYVSSEEFNRVHKEVTCWLREKIVGNWIRVRACYLRKLNIYSLPFQFSGFHEVCSRFIKYGMVYCNNHTTPMIFLQAPFVVVGWPICILIINLFCVILGSHCGGFKLADCSFFSLNITWRKVSSLCASKKNFSNRRKGLPI